MWNIKARGVLRHVLWEMLLCWLEPKCLALVVKVLHSTTQAYLSNCCSGPSTNIQKVPAKENLQLLPVPAVAFLPLSATHSSTCWLTLAIHPDPPFLQGPAQMPALPKSSRVMQHGTPLAHLWPHGSKSFCPYHSECDVIIGTSLDPL